MRALTDDQKKKLDSSVIVNLSKDPDKIKISYTVGVTPDLCEVISAVEIINIISDKTNGKGGGRSDFAQGGGNGAEKIDEIVQVIKQHLNKAFE